VTTTAPEPADEPTETPPTEQPEQPETETPNREAAKYRRQLRETETRAAALAERLEGMQRREVETQIADDLATPADIWLTDANLQEMLNDDGLVDPEKVKTSVAAVLDQRPSWRRITAASFDGGVRESSVQKQVTMQEVLQGRNRR